MVGDAVQAQGAQVRDEQAGEERVGADHRVREQVHLVEPDQEAQGGREQEARNVHRELHLLVGALFLAGAHAGDAAHQSIDRGGKALVLREGELAGDDCFSSLNPRLAANEMVTSRRW